MRLPSSPLSLRPDALFDAAARRTGLDPAGAAEARAGLEALTGSLRAEAGLSLLGRLATRQDLVCKLVNLLQLGDDERRDPRIRARPVPAPVFITGLPRSGTTFLHAVLASHPGLLAPRAWQTVFPAPMPRDAGRNVRRDRVARQLAIFHRIAPEIASLHPITADTPQECTEMAAHLFRSLRYDTTFRVPSYRAWLDRTGHDDAYAFNRRFLQHLQGPDGGARRWVLKSPDHVFALPSLRRAFPDARLVVVHRDPRRVIASVARLTELLRRPFARRIDRREIGRQVLRDWLAGLERILALEDRDIVHVRHDALIADPVGVATALCRALDIPVDAAAIARMRASAQAAPAGGYGHNRYDLAEYGIDPAEFEPARDRYRRRFEVGEDA